MSPMEPRAGAHFFRSLAAMKSIAGLDSLKLAIYIAANNRYGTFERHGPLRLGVLDTRTNPAWAGKPEVYFCFIEQGGTHFFIHAQAGPYEENDKKARATRAQGLR